MNLIKGYLPVRLSFPPPHLISSSSKHSNQNEEDRQHTFLFLKQHVSKSTIDGSGGTSDATGGGRTLFVANVPFYNGIRTRLLLRSIFERHGGGQVEKVVVVPNPRHFSVASSSSSSHSDYGITANDDGNDDGDNGDDGRRMTKGRGGGNDGHNDHDNEKEMVQLFQRELRNNIIGNIGSTRDGSGNNSNRNTAMMMSGMSVLEEDKYEWYNEGKFAHVTFASSKELKRVLLAFHKKNKGKKKKGRKEASTGEVGEGGEMNLGSLELQELQEASHKLYQRYHSAMLKRIGTVSGNAVNDDDDDDDDNFLDEQEGIIPTNRNTTTNQLGLTTMEKLAQAHRSSIPSRAFLKKACDAIMSKYEQDEEEAIRRRNEAASKPDEDGFITVVSSSNHSAAAAVGDLARMEENGTGAGAGGRRKAMKRSRNNKKNKKNVIKGSDELKDFYRFQMKESRKRDAEELKSRFEEDLKRVKRMKEDKMYRPF